MLEVLDDVRLLKQLLEFVENKLTFLQRKQSWLQLRHRSGLAEIQAEADFLKQMREALKGRISPMENNATAAAGIEAQAMAGSESDHDAGSG